MSKTYITDSEKIMVNDGITSWAATWDVDERQDVHDAFYRKGYRVYALTRFDHNAVAHDALIISRWDVGTIMEYLFQQRITVEIEAEGREEVALILVYDNPVKDILKNIRKLPVKEEVFL